MGLWRTVYLFSIPLSTLLPISSTLLSTDVSHAANEKIKATLKIKAKNFFIINLLFKLSVIIITSKAKIMNFFKKPYKYFIYYGKILKVGDFMVIAIVIAALIITLAAIMLVFFNVAFLRKDESAVNDLESAENEFLSNFKDTIKIGMDYIKNTPHTEESTVSFDNLKLVGSYYPIENSKRVIILFHGYRSSGLRDFSCAVKMYNNLGLNVLLVDQRSHGRSEGRYITFGVKERKDVLSWIGYVLKKCGNNTEIILGGLSMGATTVMLASSENLPSNVTGIIADCGFTSPKEIIIKVAKSTYHLSGLVLTFVIYIMDIYCKILGKFSIKNISTKDALKKSNIPIVIIHGKKDGFVPYEMSLENFEAAKGNKKLISVDNADHGMSFLYDEKGVLKAISEFLVSIKKML